MQLALSRLADRAGHLLRLLPSHGAGGIVISYAQIGRALIVSEVVGFEESVGAHMRRPDEGRLGSVVRLGGSSETADLIKIIIDPNGLQRIHASIGIVYLVLHKL